MGLLFSIIASILYGIQPSFISTVLEKGASSIDVSIICTIFVALFSFLLCLISKTELKLDKEFILPVICCGICFFLTNISLGMAYTHIPVGFATMIHFSYPTLVFLCCVFFFKEKATGLKVLATLLTLVGLYFISGSSTSMNLPGILLALASAVVYGSYLLISEKSAVVNCPSQKFTLYVALSGITTGLIIRLFSLIQLASSITIIIPNITMVIICALMLFVANFCLNKGIKLVGANKASSFTVIEPLTSMIFSTIMFHYSLSTPLYIGCGLILISLYLASK